jgi:hypothetical protein
VNYEHRNPIGLLHPFPIEEWKWEVVAVDFITKLPITMKQHHSIMVVVDKLIKETHFYSSEDYTKENKYCRDVYERSCQDT